MQYHDHGFGLKCSNDVFAGRMIGLIPAITLLIEGHKSTPELAMMMISTIPGKADQNNHQNKLQKTLVMDNVSLTPNMNANLQAALAKARRLEADLASP